MNLKTVNLFCKINITATMWKTFVLCHSPEMDNVFRIQKESVPRKATLAALSVLHNSDCYAGLIWELHSQGSGNLREKQPWLTVCHSP